MRSFFLCAAVLYASNATLAFTIQTLASFPASSPSSLNPEGNLLLDSAGDLFGTTTYGGANNAGMLFELPAGSNTINPVASFPGGVGLPTFITFDNAGDIYGTTTGGTIFEVAKNSSSIQTIATFAGSGSSEPVGPIVFDSAGNLFGTDASGGNNNLGTVFELPKNSSTIQTFAAFNGYNGSYPNSLLIDPAGNIYGTTDNGGSASNGMPFSGYGTIFKIAAGTNTIQSLFSFNGSNGQGANGLVRDSAGNLFGATTQGGSGTDGTVFELPANATTLTPLANVNGSNGAFPSSVMLDPYGDIFGTTSYGGQGGGTAFEIPAGTTTVLSQPFTSGQGENPLGTMVSDGLGDFFGTTSSGGENGQGTIFEIILPEPTTIALPVLALLTLRSRCSCKAKIGAHCKC